MMVSKLVSIRKLLIPIVPGTFVTRDSPFIHAPRRYKPHVFDFRSRTVELLTKSIQILYSIKYSKRELEAMKDDSNFKQYR